MELPSLTLFKYMDAITQLLRSKTVLFATILASLSIMQGYIVLLPLTPIMQMWVGVGVSGVITLLRIVTTQAIADK